MKAAVHVQEPATVHVLVKHLVDKGVAELLLRPPEAPGVADADEGPAFLVVTVRPVYAAIGPLTYDNCRGGELSPEIEPVVLGEPSMKIFYSDNHKQNIRVFMYDVP